MPPGEAERLAAIFRELAARHQPFSLLENVNLHKNGARVVLETSGAPFFDAAGQFRGYRGIDRDITDRKRAEETIEYQTYHDLLTGLPNRAQLLLRFQRELKEASRHNVKLAVLHLDLDRFKAINDSLGHTIGDRVLVAVVERLRPLLGENDTIARIGSDEFVILRNEVKRVEDAAIFARQVVEAKRQAYRIDGHELYVTASVGISMYPEDGESAETLLRNADIALSHVKGRGRNNFQFFNPAINIRTLERLLLESNLRHAIDRDELVLHYQPLVSIRTGEVMCFEALARWRHADLGLLNPVDFIPVAEEIGFITAIDEWVLRTACAQNKAWQNAGCQPRCVTVNLSAEQFLQPTLVRMVAGIVEEVGLDPRYLDIEITESTAMRDIDLAIPNIRGLNELGVQLSIDDFGTGYSSLNYLKRFSVHTLKIDQSFIREVTTDPDDQAIVRAVIAMGHSLQLKVIAEGVETREQHLFLMENGCDEMQGFFFSKPLPAEELGELVTAWK
jgi:diguanylate cyclase (GGDEF)-like protein